MKMRALFAKIATLSLVALGLMSQVVWAQGNGENQPTFVPGRILVKFKDGVSDGQARGLLAGRGALSTNVIPGIDVHIVQLPPNANEQAEANAFKGLETPRTSLTRSAFFRTIPETSPTARRPPAWPYP